MLGGTRHKLAGVDLTVEKRRLVGREEAPIVLLLVEHAKGEGSFWIGAFLFQIYVALMHGIDRNN